VTSTYLPSLEKLHLIFPTTQINTKSTPAAHRKTWIWSCQHTAQAIPILEALLPYLVTKRAEAQVALCYLRYRARHAHPGVRYSKQELRQHELVYWRLRELKKEAK